MNEIDLTQIQISGHAMHGNIPFEVPLITEIVPGLWQGGVVRSVVLPGHIKHLVSLFPWEQYRVGHTLVSGLAVMLDDSEDQDMSFIDHIARWVNTCREDGDVLVHCQVGLNRSSLVVARSLMLGGLIADDAINLIRSKRSPTCLCNPAFEKWLRSHG